MGYIFNNPNPADSFVGDCVVRAISIAEDISWNDAYMNLCEIKAEIMEKLQELDSAN